MIVHKPRHPQVRRAAIRQVPEKSGHWSTDDTAQRQKGAVPKCAAGQKSCKNCAVDPVDCTDTFIACADDCPAQKGTVPPGSESIAARTWRLISESPYRCTSGDVIFTAYAGRQEIPQEDDADPQIGRSALA